MIGAKYFDIGYKSLFPDETESDNGARDTDGHGTHTLSTAGGSFVPEASLFGFAKGTSKGGSPAARVASYKVCWGIGCTSVDILAGFDEAIHDGVDVLSVSLGGDPEDYFTDPIAVGAFHAVLNGIHVACSAGNSGPNEGSVTNSVPWVTTVAASSLDRDYINFAVLGNRKFFAVSY